MKQLRHVLAVVRGRTAESPNFQCTSVEILTQSATVMLRHVKELSILYDYWFLQELKMKLFGQKR